MKCVLECKCFKRLICDVNGLFSDCTISLGLEWKKQFKHCRSSRSCRSSGSSADQADHVGEKHIKQFITINVLNIALNIDSAL